MIKVIGGAANVLIVGGTKNGLLGAEAHAALARNSTVPAARALAGRDDAVTLTLPSGDRRALMLIRHARVPF